MNADRQTLNNLPDGKPVRIFIPVLNGTEKAKAQCIYKESKPPKFDLIFKPGVLDVDEIDIKMPCTISIDAGGPTITMEAMITRISNPQTLQMIAMKSISHEQMREFFRVDAVTEVISKSFSTNRKDKPEDSWALPGESVDISGSGILAIFETLPPADEQIRLDITIPLPEPYLIKVLAHQVRCIELNDGKHEIAYHFDDISTEDRDAIIRCCLVLQRRMLRLKVQVKNTTIR